LLNEWWLLDNRGLLDDRLLDDWGLLDGASCQ
jgi:hypothetical protein